MKAEFKIPTELDEIALVNYQKFMRTSKGSTDNEFVCQKMIELFCGIRLRNVLEFKWSDVKELTVHFGEMFKERPKFQHRFKIQDTEFGFIPDLENISFGEFIDLSKNITDVDNWHKAMAVMYRPIIDSKGDKYSIEDYKGSNTYSEVMKFAPLGVTLGANVFFWTLRNDLLNSSLSYLKKIMNKENNLQTLAQKLNLTDSTVGIHQFMQSLMETSLSSEMSLDYQYESVLCGYLLKSKSEILRMKK